MERKELLVLDRALGRRETGLFVVHGSTGTGKTTLMHMIASRAAGIHERTYKIIANASLSPKMRPEALHLVTTRGYAKPPVVVFGEIRDQTDTERAIYLAGRQLVIAEMHDERFERVTERLVWDGAQEDDVRDVLVGQASLAYDDDDVDAPIRRKTHKPLFRRPEGPRVLIAVRDAEPMAA